jgi:hypothetical protein
MGLTFYFFRTFTMKQKIYDIFFSGLLKTGQYLLDSSMLLNVTAIIVKSHSKYPFKNFSAPGQSVAAR